MKIHKAVIPAAGIGTRLLPATKSQPKEMLPVGRKPTIQYVVEEIAAAGVKDVLIITNQQKRTIEDHFDVDIALEKLLEEKGMPLDVLNHLNLGIHLFSTRQSIPKGLGDAIGMAEDFVSDEHFAVSLGDAIIHSKQDGSLLHRLIDTHIAKNAGATIAFRKVNREDVVKYGIASPKDEGKGDRGFQLKDIVEKPSVEDAPSTLAIAARYIFSSEIFQYIKRTKPGAGGEIQITDSIRLMIEEGLPVWGVKLAPDEKRYDIGNYKSYFESFFDFSLIDPEFGEAFREYAKRRLALVEDYPAQE